MEQDRFPEDAQDYGSPLTEMQDQCNVYLLDGRCPEMTGSTEAGIDADLCSTHRIKMHAQRVANALRWKEFSGA